MPQVWRALLFTDPQQPGGAPRERLSCLEGWTGQQSCNSLQGRAAWAAHSSAFLKAKSGVRLKATGKSCSQLPFNGEQKGSHNGAWVPQFPESQVALPLSNLSCELRSAWVPHSTTPESLRISKMAASQQVVPVLVGCSPPWQLVSHIYPLNSLTWSPSPFLPLCLHSCCLFVQNCSPLFPLSKLRFWPQGPTQAPSPPQWLPWLGTGNLPFALLPDSLFPSCLGLPLTQTSCLAFPGFDFLLYKMGGIKVSTSQGNSED